MNTGTIPTARALSTAAWIGRLAYAIAMIGAVASYGTQVALFCLRLVVETPQPVLTIGRR